MKYSESSTRLRTTRTTVQRTFKMRHRASAVDVERQPDQPIARRALGDDYGAEDDD